MTRDLRRHLTGRATKRLRIRHRMNYWIYESKPYMIHKAKENRWNVRNYDWDMYIANRYVKTDRKIMAMNYELYDEGFKVNKRSYVTRPVDRFVEIM